MKIVLSWRWQVLCFLAQLAGFGALACFFLSGVRWCGSPHSASYFYPGNLFHHNAQLTTCLFLGGNKFIPLILMLEPNDNCVKAQASTGGDLEPTHWPDTALHDLEYPPHTTGGVGGYAMCIFPHILAFFVHTSQGSALMIAVHQRGDKSMWVPKVTQFFLRGLQNSAPL